MNLLALGLKKQRGGINSMNKITAGQPLAAKAKP